jgi:hypothetical protein
MRKAFGWLEKAVAYLDELKPAVTRRFDLGHGIVFASPRLTRASLGQHERRIVGYPALDEINIYYEISSTKPVIVEVPTLEAALVETVLDDANLPYTSRMLGTHDKATLQAITVAAGIPAATSMHMDYETGIVRMLLMNVDRFDRLSLEFRIETIDEPMLEDFIRFMLGQSDALLHRAHLTGIHGQPRG